MAKEKLGKPQLSLIYLSAMTGMAQVREFGVKKYGHPEDWRGVPREDYYDAALRHIMKAKEAENKKDIKGMLDEESGLNHLAHAMTNLMFLIESMQSNAIVCMDCGIELVHHNIYGPITEPRCVVCYERRKNGSKNN